MANPDLEVLLAQQDARFCVNVSNATACLSEFRSESPDPESKIAFVAYTIIRRLATGDKESIWRVFGDIIAKWTGSPSTQNLSDAVKHEREWVESFRRKAAPADEETLVSKVRNAIASLRLEYVPTTAFAAFVEFAAAANLKEEELARAAAIHHRSDSHVDSIFILPFLPQLEALIKSERLPPTAWDVVVVATAKTIIHELRHMIGTLLNGGLYCTPPMVQGSFAPPLSPNDAEKIPAECTQCEAGEWYEVSHYGAVLYPALVSPTELGTLDSATLFLTGHLLHRRGPCYLLPSNVSALAKRVWDGSFVNISSPFFRRETILPVTGYILQVEELLALEDITTPRRSAQQTPWRPTTIARRSGPHSAAPLKLRPIVDGMDMREIGYGNFRGVLMG
ncbi:hypothetical protein B0H12DRAFT_1132174 [Mycena haematopus]|nr:hypothetical protein B0H12DRAFT_1132174 [Mycena haematopus]